MSHISGKNESSDAVRLLLINTCGDDAGVAVSVGEQVITSQPLPRGGGSAEIVNAVEQVLTDASCRLAELDGVGVVSGPGSFTGVRVGMAAAKGFAEAAQLRMLAVSRLVVLSEAAGNHATGAKICVALDAGRGEFYVAERVDGSTGPEQLVDLTWLKEHELDVVVAEERLASRLNEAAPELPVHLRTLCVEDALGPLLRMYHRDASQMSLADANYVRRESDIYKTKAGADIP